MKAQGWLGLAALLFVVVGVIFGATPIKADGFDCGTAFKESSELNSDELLDTMIGGTGENACDEARANRQPIAWGALAVGGVLGVAALVVAVSSSGARRSSEPV